MDVSEAVDSAVQALRDERWGDYNEIAWQAGKGTMDGGAFPLELAKKHGDIDLIASVGKCAQACASDALRRLLKAVCHLDRLSNAEASQLMHACDISDNSLNASFSKAMEVHFARDSSLAEALGLELTAAGSERKQAEFVWTRAFCRSCPEPAARFAVDHLLSGANPTRFLAHLVTAVPMEMPEVRAVLEPVQSRIHARLTETLQARSPNWDALANIAEFSPASAKTILLGLQEGQPGAVSTVAHRLTWTSWPYACLGSTLFDLTDLILKSGVVHEETRPDADRCLAHLLESETTRSEILLLLHKLGVSSVDLTGFPETLGALAHTEQLHAEVLTSWLLWERIQLNNLRVLLSKCENGRARFTIQKEALAAAPEGIVQRAVQRLILLTHSSDLRFEFAALLAETPELQPAGRSLAGYLLNETFGDFPRSTLEFLKAKTRPADRDAEWAKLYRGIYARALWWQRVLKRLPTRRELNPSPLQRAALRASRLRFRREVDSRSNEGSFWASLFKPRHYAQGSRFAYEVVGHGTQVTQMQTVSIPIEMPTSELSDPVGAMMRRVKLQENS